LSYFGRDRLEANRAVHSTFLPKNWLFLVKKRASLVAFFQQEKSQFLGKRSSISITAKKHLSITISISKINFKKSEIKNQSQKNFVPLWQNPKLFCQ
jgi:hypothetical protein